MEQMPRAAVDPLVVGGVIGDVVDMFVPAADLSLHYGTKHLCNGMEINPHSAAQSPRLLITASVPVPTPNYYTLVCKLGLYTHTHTN